MSCKFGARSNATLLTKPKCTCLLKWGRNVTSMVTTFNCHWKKSIKSWIGTNNLAFCSGWNGPKNYLISKYTKYVFKIQRVRHSPNTLLTMVDDQVLRMITRHRHVREIFLIYASSKVSFRMLLVMFDVHMWNSHYFAISQRIRYSWYDSVWTLFY